MKLDRLLSIVMLLLYRRTSTVSELAARFAVSERTIYRDLQTLDLAGFPIVSSVGRGGGIGLLPGYRLEKRFFSAESLALFSASLSAVADLIGDTDMDADKRIVEGLVGAEADRPPIHLSFSDAGTRKIQPLLRDISRCIREARCLRIEYASGDGTVSGRVIEPLRLAWLGTDWYLQAWCRLRKDYRLFRIRRMRSYTVGKAAFNRAARLSALPDPKLEPDPAALPPERIVLDIDASRADLRQRLAADIAQTREDGSFAAEMLWPVTDWVAS